MTDTRCELRSELATWFCTSRSERRPVLTLEEILGVAVEALDVSLEDLSGPDQTPELVAKRRLLVIAARSHGHELAEIRAAFNLNIAALLAVPPSRNQHFMRP